MSGNAFYNTFKLIAKNPLQETPALDLPESTVKDCCEDFDFDVLADDTNDETKNDINGFLWWFDPVVSTAALSLWKHDPTQPGADSEGFYQVALLNDSTYGTAYAYGFFTNDQGEKFVGYQIEWSKVLDEEGEGTYKVKCIVTLSYGGTGTIESYKYCLKTYTPSRADGTVRLEYYLSGVTGDVNDTTKIKDFGDLNWYNSMRLPGWFGFLQPTHKEEFIKYNSGELKFVESEQEEEYELQIKQRPMNVHRTIKTDFIQADQKFITDYNKNNVESIVRLQVNLSGAYTIEYAKLRSKLAPAKAKFKPAFNNFRKLRN